MDVEFLNSSPQAQIDLINVMMQMEKLSEFPNHRQLLQPHPLPAAFPSGGGLSISPPTPFINFVGTASQENLKSFDADNQASVAAMREMIFRIAAMQPVHIDPESVKPPKRKNVRISKDPQSVAARHRRERISERIRILQRLVPGGTKMDTASMLDEAIHYMKFLKFQVQSLERAMASRSAIDGIGFGSGGNYSCFGTQQENINNTYS